MKLRTRILLVALPISIVSIILLEIVSFSFIKKEIVQQLTGRTDVVVKYLSDEIKMFVTSSASTIEQYGDFPIFEQYTKYSEYGLNEEASLAKKEILATFKKLLNRNAHYIALSYYDGKGKQVVLEQRSNKLIEQSNISYNQFPERKDIAISDAYYNRAAEQNFLNLKYDINSHSEHYGSIIISVSLNTLFEQLHKEKITPNSTIYVYDNNDNIIYASDRRNNLQQNTKDVMVYSAPQTVPLVNWRVKIAAPKAEVFALLTKLQWLAAGVIALAILGKVLFLGYLSGWISRPINKILKIIDDSTRDGLNVPEGVENYRWLKEFRQIAVSFRNMCVRLKEMQERLIKKAALITMGEMASHIAHDMRSPIAVLNRFTETVQPNNSDEKELREAASRSVNKLLYMAEELVDYSKASRLEYKTCPLHDFFHNTVCMEIQERASSAGVEVVCKIDDNICVNLDAYKMGRALVNLLNNAIQAISNGNGIVSLTAKVENGDSLMINISDNGCGIDAENIPHIFDSFFTKGKKGGTGLGLSYCKQVIEAHGGTINVQSEIGKGTSFTIQIPHAARSGQTAQIETNVSLRGIPIQQAESVSVSSANKIDELPHIGNVLIADDDLDARLQLLQAISKLKGTVVCAITVPDDLISHSSDGFDYSSIDNAIIDYHYEGSKRDGVELVAFLKEKGVKRIHLCTGYYKDERIIRRAITAGADSIIPKPFKINDISKLLQTTDGR